MTDDLISFKEYDYSSINRIHRLEQMVQTLSSQLNDALLEIASLRQQLYDHTKCFHDNEPRSRFTIQHIPKGAMHKSSSSEAILIDV